MLVEHRDADDERPDGLPCGRLGAAALRGRLHHRHAARGVHVDHPGAGRDRRLDRLRHGVRDVVELEVEEHRGARVGERADERRAFQREQPAADLEAAGERRAARRPAQRRAPLSTSSATRS